MPPPELRGRLQTESVRKLTLSDLTPPSSRSFARFPATTSRSRGRGLSTSWSWRRCWLAVAWSSPSSLLWHLAGPWAPTSWLD